jgi:DnaJ-class molecular chaperone
MSPGTSSTRKVFQEILTAYETLVDPIRRESYDLGIS